MSDMGRWQFGWMAFGVVLALAAMATAGAVGPESVATAAPAAESIPATIEPLVAGVLVNRLASPECTYPDGCSPTPACRFELTRTLHPRGYAPVFDSSGTRITYDANTLNVDMELTFGFVGCGPTSTRWMVASGPGAGDSGEAEGSQAGDRPMLQCRYDDNGAVTEVGLRGLYTVEAVDQDGNVLPGGRAAVTAALSQTECEGLLFHDA
ncbi:MAG: hypothetical protein GY929_08770 [Actinomycetia bacterium]|nr:hypothetical protein [Actinomycetes bacterium]